MKSAYASKGVGFILDFIMTVIGKKWLDPLLSIGISIVDGSDRSFSVTSINNDIESLEKGKKQAVCK